DFRQRAQQYPNYDRQRLCANADAGQRPDGWQRKDHSMKWLLAIIALALPALAQKPVPTMPMGISCNSTYTSCSGTVFDTSYSLPMGGATWAVHTAAQFTAALNGYAPGDVIVMDAGTVYSGNFVVPAKANPLNKWTYVTTSNYGSLPAPGTKVSPSDSANMP